MKRPDYLNQIRVNIEKAENGSERLTPEEKKKQLFLRQKRYYKISLIDEQYLKSSLIKVLEI